LNSSIRIEEDAARMESAVQQPKAVSNADGHQPEAPMAVGISSTGNGRTTFVRG
jgi:hypothetical protein